jgi:hypothetical protein
MRRSAAGELSSIHTAPRFQNDQKLWVTQNKNQSTFVQYGTTQALHAVTAPIKAQFCYCTAVATVSMCNWLAMPGTNVVKQQKFIYKI